MAAAAESTAIQRDAAPGLSEITNKENAKTASFPIVVKNSHIQVYSYTSHNKQQEGAKLVCILQCENGTDYCLGVAKMQGKDKAELKNLQDTSWRDNTVWRLSEIVLLPEKPQWIHTNNRVCINLRRTKKQALLQCPTFAPTPVPANKIADILQLKETQRFDLQAIIREIMTERTSQQGLQIIEARLIDGSRNSRGDYAVLPTTMFFKNTTETEAFKKHAAAKTPVNFMCMQGTYKDGKITVGPVKDQSWLQPAAGEQSEALAQQAETLCTDELVVQDVATINGNTTGGPIDYNADPATLTVVQLLDTAGTFIKQQLTTETYKIFQVNCVYWPPPTKEDTITTKDGKRLFAPVVEISDSSGKVQVAARAKAMIHMSGLEHLKEEEAQEEYIQQWEKNELRHSLLCSIRVKVEAKTMKMDSEANSQGSEPTEAGTTYNAIIVEAERINAIDWPPIPEESMRSLHTMLSHCTLGSDRLLAIALTKLQPARFSNMAGTIGDGDPLPFDKCLGLLRFTKATNGKQHPNGIRLLGEKVQDATAEGTDDEGASKHYGTIALSNFEKMGDFHISQGGITALAVITRVTTAACSEKHVADLHIEAMQQVPAACVPKAVHMLRQLQSMAEMTAADPSASSEVAERQVKCRRLLRWPTDTTANTA